MISSPEQLRAAADRLGAKLEDVQELFRARIALPSRRNNSDSLVSNIDAQTSLFESDAVSKALDESLFAICENAFSISPSQGTAFSPGYSTPTSPPLLNSTQLADDNNSPASASSSAAAAQRQTHSRRRSHVLRVCCDDAAGSEDGPIPAHVCDENVSRQDTDVTLSRKEVLAGSGKDSGPQNGRQVHLPSKTRSESSPTTPLGYLISFAHGHQFNFADFPERDEQLACRKMRTLAIIPGCDEYSYCCLFKYIEALFKAHVKLVQNLPDDTCGLVAGSIDSLKSEMTDTSWMAIILDTAETRPVRERITQNCPPMLRNTMDLFQFTFRLVEKMSSFSDSLTRKFLEGIYASDTPMLVASLATEMLARWAEVWHKTKSFQRQSLPLEWCIRLMIDFIVYELSPVSQMRQMADISADSFLTFHLGKGGLPPLSVVIDYCFEFVSSIPAGTGKECRIALCELVQAYVIRCTCPSPSGSVQEKLWTETQDTQQEFLNSLIRKEAFWTIIVHPALQHVRKLPQPADSCFDYSFLTSLVSHSTAMRALFDDKQNKSRWMLLNAIIRNLELMNRDLLSCFVEAAGHRKSFPGIYTSTDLIYSLIASAAVQREILGADAVTKDRFLSSLELLVANSAKLVRFSLEIDEAMSYARKGPYAKTSSAGLERCEADFECGDSRPVTKKGDEQMSSVDRNLARQQAVAFAAKLIGFMGKSVEDGSWDMSQMNTIKALLYARINSSRARQRLWNDMYKIQRGVEKRMGGHTLLSVPERNSFAMVVEVVRKHAVCDSKDRETSLRSHDDLAGSQLITSTNATRDVDASFPPVWDVPELQHAVCSSKGYTDFDDNHNMFTFMKDALMDKGQQMLARYDPDSPFTIKWIRLQKRNAYIDQARELLDKSDRTVGQRCSCVPGYSKDNGKGNESRVACSNDLCENRHMKIECVPGECGAGSYCMNQRMQNLEYAKYKMVPFPGKGVGIVADEDISEGALVGEYQGEVVAMEEYERRVHESEGERHFYFMTLTSKLVIDASRKSQATRFLNHSCDPNAETQKWNADGEPRVGIFAKRAIVKGEEITFDYGARSLTQYSARCLCGSENCRGLLAVRQEEAGRGKEMTSESPDQGEIPAETAHDRDSKSPKRKRRRLLEEESRRSVVKKKMEAAKRHLHESDAFSKKAEKGNPPSRFDRSLSQEIQQKLKVWKASLARGRGITLVPGKDSQDPDGEVRFPRIPRRIAVPVRHEKGAAEKSVGESTERVNSSKEVMASRDVDSQAKGRNVQTSTSTRMAPSASRWSLFEESSAGKHGDSQYTVKRQAEADGFRRFSKLPRAGFLPTTSKLKKQPQRPKFARRKRTREQDGNDSMDDYSTASEAEPVLEEPATSPRRLPDGNGACSEDEFVAAPPVESIRLSSDGMRWDHSDHDRGTCDERKLNRREFVRGDEQKRDGPGSSFGPSHRLTRDKSDPNMQLHFRPGHRVQSLRKYERFPPLRAEPWDDDVTHEAGPSGFVLDRRRYADNRHGWSPPKEGHRQPQSRVLENGRGVKASVESAGSGPHAKLRVAKIDPLDRTGHGNEYQKSRRGYRPSIPSMFRDARERRPHCDVLPTLRGDENKRWTRRMHNNMLIPMLGKGGSTNQEYHTSSQGDTDRIGRRKEDIRRMLHDDAHVAHGRAYGERSEPSRFHDVAASHSVTNIEGRPRYDDMPTHHGDKDKRWAPSHRLGDTVDLRNVITQRSRNKSR